MDWPLQVNYIDHFTLLLFFLHACIFLFRIVEIDIHQRARLEDPSSGAILKEKVPYAQMKPYKTPDENDIPTPDSPPSLTLPFSLPQDPLPQPSSAAGTALVTSSPPPIPPSPVTTSLSVPPMTMLPPAPLSTSSLSVPDSSLPKPSLQQYNDMQVSFCPQVHSRKRQQDIAVVKITAPKTRANIVLPVSRLAATSPRLTEMLRTVMSPNTWLSDEEINHGQALLRQQFPEVDGWQDVGLFGDNGCHLLGTPQRPFVQVMLTFENHWICVSNIGCPAGVVRLFDSMYKKRSNALLKKQLAWMLHTEESSMTLEWPCSSKQKGNNDCGLYALANAIVLCSNLNPQNCRFIQAQMRPHLANCFRYGRMLPFPSAACNQNDQPFVEQVPVVCNCRQPVDRRLLVECVLCKERYHRTCEKMPKDAWGEKKAAFHCAKCARDE